eukprot:4584447-Amphidinium_carterae.1
MTDVGAAEQLELHRLVLCARCPDALTTPPGIHWACKWYEPELLTLSGVLALLDSPEQKAALAAGTEEQPWLAIVAAFERGVWARLTRYASEAASLAALSSFAGRASDVFEDLAPYLIEQDESSRWAALRVALALATAGVVSPSVLTALKDMTGKPLDVRQVRKVMQQDLLGMSLVLDALAKREALATQALAMATELLLDSSTPEPVRRHLIPLLVAHNQLDTILGSWEL